MKVRLFILVFVSIAGAVLLGALAMLAFLSNNLDAGFRNYLAARDDEQLERMAEDVTAEVRRRGGVQAVRSGEVDLLALFPENVRFRNNRKAPGPANPTVRTPGKNRLPRPPEALGQRIFVYDWQGTQIAGPPEPPDGIWPFDTKMVDLEIDGEAFGRLVMLARARSPAGDDARFLAEQYRSAAVIAVLLALAGLLPALFAARAGEKQAVAFQQASDAIARGDYKARAPSSMIAEIDKVGKDINDMAEALGRLERARRRWLAEIAHELRTPLAALLGELESVEDGVRPLDTERFQSVREEAQHLGRLVEDLHQLAMADLEALSCAFNACNAGALCRAAVERFELQAQEAGLALHFDGPDGDVAVYWDAMRIEQLLANGLTNALRYTDAPGEVRLALKPAEDSIEILIDDSPPGVPEWSREALFEPLFRLEEARDRASGGSGLGLAIARAIAFAHGGTLTAMESPLGGLRLRLDLPRVAVSRRGRGA